MDWHNLQAWKKCISGATAIEYGLIAAAISVAITLSLFFFGDQVQAVLEGIVDVVAQVNTSLS